jgi:hypothetical protein
LRASSPPTVYRVEATARRRLAAVRLAASNLADATSAAPVLLGVGRHSDLRYAINASRSLADNPSAAPCALPGIASGGVSTARIASFVDTARCSSGTVVPPGLSGLRSSAQQPFVPVVQLGVNAGSVPTDWRPADPRGEAGEAAAELGAGRADRRAALDVHDDVGERDEVGEERILEERRRVADATMCRVAVNPKVMEVAL